MGLTFRHLYHRHAESIQAGIDTSRVLDSRMFRRSSWIGVLLTMALTLLGCDDKPAPAAAGSAAATSSAAPTSSATVAIVFDGEKSEAKIVSGERRPLSEFLPGEGRDPKSWRQLLVKSSDGRKLNIVQYADRYEHHDVLLYLDDESRLTLGIYRQLRPGMPEHAKRSLEHAHMQLVNATEVVVRTTEEPLAKGERPHLEIRVGDAVQMLSADELDALESKPRPGKGKKMKPKGKERKEGKEGKERKGQASWHLADVVALSKEKGPFEIIAVVDSEQGEVELDIEVLTDEKRWPALRYNRRGLLAFDLHDVETGKRINRLRGVVAIRLERKK
jgi:hypothetical protein